VFAHKPWAGGKLPAFGKNADPGVGESWEVADLPPGENQTVPEPWTVVDGGRFDGWTLSALIRRFGNELMGSAPSIEGRFPLLVKLLDAGQHLSIQVHPPAPYVRIHRQARLKTESWYVLAAEPGAHLLLGTRPGVDRKTVVAAIGSSDLAGLLRSVPAIPGTFHHLPAGLIHALGAGVVVAEVQTPSDTTFRMYDWTEEYGRPRRQLHFVQAAEALDLDPPDAFDLAPAAGDGSRLLVETPFYSIREHRGVGPEWSDTEPRVVMVLAGSMEIAGRIAPTGSTWLVPASIAAAVPIGVSGDLICLDVGLGSGGG
jgi:mannose-6-phosphate isomerase